MAYKFTFALMITLAYLNGYEGIKCYQGTGSPAHPPSLDGMECSEDIINCLKMVSSNKKGDIVGIQYQCGTSSEKENGCASQDPSEPFEVDDDDDMDTMMNKEMKELEKDTQDSLVDEAKSGEETTPKILTFPPNARISKSEVKKLDGGSNPRDVEWSDKVEDNVKRSKRDTDDHNKHMFCYCDEDLCNDSTSLRGAVFLSGLSFTLVLIFNRFY
uniref:Protein sleepless n=1 Tax=Lepeophtheirus salmonis TaxID=72036 RepID=A0A0K2V0U0_LEPSM